MSEYWRKERYRFLESHAASDFPVITAHHLDDVVEWWIFSSLRGLPALIPYQRGHVIRPFLLTSRDEITKWCKEKELDWVDDPFNLDTYFSRNFIRHEMVPLALKVNPGLRTTIANKIKEKYSWSTCR
jgi:tRNA(Ile)-lysidine synthase